MNFFNTVPKNLKNVNEDDLQINTTYYYKERTANDAIKSLGKFNGIADNNRGNDDSSTILHTFDGKKHDITNYELFTQSDSTGGKSRILQNKSKNHSSSTKNRPSKLQKKKSYSKKRIAKKRYTAKK